MGPRQVARELGKRCLPISQSQLTRPIDVGLGKLLTRVWPFQAQTGVCRCPTYPLCSNVAGLASWLHRPPSLEGQWIGLLDLWEEGAGRLPGRPSGFQSARTMRSASNRVAARSIRTAPLLSRRRLPCREALRPRRRYPRRLSECAGRADPLRSSATHGGLFGLAGLSGRSAALQAGIRLPSPPFTSTQTDTSVCLQSSAAIPWLPPVGTRALYGPGTS